MNCSLWASLLFNIYERSVEESRDEEPRWGVWGRGNNNIVRDRKCVCWLSVVMRQRDHRVIYDSFTKIKRLSRGPKTRQALPAPSQTRRKRPVHWENDRSRLLNRVTTTIICITDAGPFMNGPSVTVSGWQSFSPVSPTKWLPSRSFLPDLWMSVQNNILWIYTSIFISKIT